MLFLKFPFLMKLRDLTHYMDVYLEFTYSFVQAYCQLKLAFLHNLENAMFLGVL